MFEGVWEVTQNLDFLENCMIFDRTLGSCVLVPPLVFDILKDISQQEKTVDFTSIANRHNVNAELFFEKMRIDLTQYGIMKRI